MRCVCPGNYKTTQEILSRLDKNVPGLVMVAMRRISLERRQGNHEEAERLFKDYLEKTTSNKCRTFFAIKFTRYLQKVSPCYVVLVSGIGSFEGLLPLLCVCVCVFMQICHI